MEELVQIPQEFLCPISTQLMIDPVIAGDGITYQRKSIEQWMTKSNDSPFTGKRLPHKTLIINYALKNTIENFSNKLPAIMKEKQIKIDLQYAIKVKQDDMKSYIEKMELRKIDPQKQYQKDLKIRQLQRELLIQRKTHQETQKMFVEARNKNASQQLQIEDLREEIRNLKFKAQYNSFEQKKIKENQIDNISRLKQIREGFEIETLPQNLCQVLKKSKRIYLSINNNSFDFNQKNLKINEKNPSCCQGTGIAFSRQVLPIKKNQNFYYVIKVNKVMNKCQLAFGFANPQDLKTMSWSKLNRVTYSISLRKIFKFNAKFQENAKYENTITQFPSYLFLFINEKDKLIQWIYNGKIQAINPLQQKMLSYKNQCYAYVCFDQGEVEFL